MLLCWWQLKHSFSCSVVTAMESRSQAVCRALKGYFVQAYGSRLAVDVANDMLKDLEKLPKEHCSKLLGELKVYLADLVMTGGECP